MHRNYLAKAIFKYFEQKYGKGKEARSERRLPHCMVLFKQSVVFYGVPLRFCYIKNQNTRILSVFNDSLKTDSSDGKIFSVMSCLSINEDVRIETQYFHHDTLPPKEFVSEIHKLLDNKDKGLKSSWPVREGLLNVA